MSRIEAGRIERLRRLVDEARGALLALSDEARAIGESFLAREAEAAANEIHTTGSDTVRALRNGE